MQTNSITLRSGIWCGERTVRLDFPGHWNVETHHAGPIPTLSTEKIAARIENPVDGFSLEALLHPDKKVVIVIDDHTRPTPVAEILRPVLGILRQSGIRNRNIKVLVAIGTHILDQDALLREKLGGLMDNEIEVIVPDCRDSRQLTYLGQSETGVPVYINKHFAEADVRVAISGIYPHDEAGFSGGAKILIGILGLSTLSRFHRRHELLQRGSVIETPFRNELEHFADMAGLNYSFNCLLNQEGKIAELFCGDFHKAFRAAASEAQCRFGIRFNPDADVQIVNAYPLDNSPCVLGKSTWPFKYSKNGAFKIVITALCGDPGDRIPLAAGAVERMLQRLKRMTGLPLIRQAARDLRNNLRIRRNPCCKWKNPYVIHIPHFADGQNYRPCMIGHSYVVYDWATVVGELMEHFGPEYPANVSIFPFTPLHFPVLDY